MTSASPSGLPSTRLDRRKTLSLLFIASYIVIIALLSALDLEAPFNQPLVLLLLNVVFLGLIPIYVASISLVSFRKNGLASILMMGAGMLFFGLASIAAGMVGLLPDSSNLVVTNHNVGACVGAFLQFAGALTALVGWRESRLERRGNLALAVYAGVGIAAAALLAATLLGLTPAFFATGAGSTVVRALVLAGAVVFSLLASALFFVLYRRRHEGFFFWYAVGVALIGLGLLAVSFYPVFDDLLNWAARFGQYVGACYILAAFLVLRQRAESGGQSVQELLTSFFSEAEAGYRQLVETAGDAIVVLDPALRVLLWNTAAEQMFGYTDDEAVGRSFPGLVLGDADVPALGGNADASAAADSGSAALGRQEIEARRKDGSRIPVEMTVSRRSVAGRMITTCIVRDLTERRRTEAALQESEADARSFIENLVDACAICETVYDAGGRPIDIRLVEVNPALARELDLPASAIVGRTAFDLLPELAGLWFDRFLEVDRTRTAIEVEEPFPALGRWYRVVGFPVRGGRIAVVFRDITLRKEAEEALQESEEKFRALYERSLDAIILTDPRGEGRVLSANPAACRMFGLTEEELIGRGRDALLNRDDPEVTALLQQREQAGAACTELMYRRRDGSTFPGELSTAIFTDSRGDIRAVAIIRDITERKRAELELARYAEDLRESRQQLADVIEATGAGYYHFAVDASHGSISRRGAEILGVPPEEMPRFPEFARWALARVHPDDVAPLLASFGAFVAGETERNEVEFRVRVPDGGYRWIQAISTSVDRDEAGRVTTLAGFLFDITERKEAEAALHRSNEELQRFAYVASHDLQEPLRSIISFSQLLDRRYKGKLDPDADDYIGFIVEGGNRMQTLIQDLLQVSRFETGAKPLEPTDAGEVVASVLRLLEAPIRETGATVTVGPMPRVLADATQIEQVFTNLIGNALKYRRPDVPPEVRIAADRKGDWWEFAVQDNGIGIEAEYFDRIFEMFRRLHTHDQYQGTGIGLAIVKRIVERHGGRIRVESTPGEGSTFIFTLPAV